MVAQIPNLRSCFSKYHKDNKYITFRDFPDDEKQIFISNFLAEVFTQLWLDICRLINTIMFEYRQNLFIDQ